MVSQHISYFVHLSASTTPGGFGSNTGFGAKPATTGFGAQPSAGFGAGATPGFGGGMYLCIYKFEDIGCENQDMIDVV